MKRLLLLLLLCSCADRAALDAEYRAEQRYLVEQTCLRGCVRVFDGCVLKRHESGSCHVQFADCSRECR